jgi:hypothetical protein
LESVVSEHPLTLDVEFRWKIRSILEISKSSRPKMTTRELKTVKFFRLNKDIKILQADKYGAG